MFAEIPMHLAFPSLSWKNKGTYMLKFKYEQVMEFLENARESV